MNVFTLAPVYPPDRGGIATVVRAVNEGLARRGHRCSVLVAGDTRVTRGPALRAGVELVGHPAPSSRWLMGYVPGLKRALGRYSDVWMDADVAHLHSVHTLLSPQGVRLLGRAGKRTLVSTHYHARGHRLYTKAMFPLYERYLRRVLEEADAIVCVSEHEADLLRERLHPSTPLAVIPNGVPAIGPPGERSARERPTFLYVGHLRRYKGVDLVIRGLGCANRRGLDGRLVIVGRGPDERRLRKLAAREGVSDAVEWRAGVSADELQRLYLSADALFMLSEAEAFGLVAAEALALGTPAILRDGSALREFGHVPGCVLLQDPITPEAVAAVMREPPAEARVPDRDLKIRTWDQVAADHEALYEKVGVV